MSWPGTLSFVLFALAALVLTRRLRPRGPVDALLLGGSLLAGQILIAGYILSALGRLADVAAWLAAAAALLTVVAAVPRVHGPRERLLRLRIVPASRHAGGATGRLLPRWRSTFASLARGYAGLGAFEKRLFMPPLVIAAILALVNLDMILHTAPHNWDSMTYHLARMAYYLQNGSLANYGANFWAQTVHPKNATLLVLYTYLASGRNENLTQLVQFAAYGLATVAVYGIARCIGSPRWAALFAAGIFALLIECLMQATTTQNDMVLTALVGCAVYGLLAFRERRARGYLVLTALAAGIALGVKSTLLLSAPALAVVALYALYATRGQPSTAFPPTTGGTPLRMPAHPAPSPESSLSGRAAQRPRRDTLCRRLLARSAFSTAGSLSGPTAQRSQRDTASRRLPSLHPLVFLFVALALSGLIFAAPAGYIENWQIYGHPVGPEYVRRLHAFEGESFGSVARYGTRNFVRFGFEFLSLDGLPPYGDIYTVQQSLRRWPRAATLRLGLNLETPAATRAPFDYDKRPTAHEDGSYWGIFGFALLGPAALLALLVVLRPPAARALAAAGLLFWMAQAFSGPYDPWRGRYFIVAGVFVAPLAADLVTRRLPGLLKVYLVVVVLLGCLSALSAVLGRANSVPEEVYGMDRAGQLTRNRRNYTEPVRRFETAVPPTATVAVYLGEDMFEYPLFGEGLTRRLLPVNPFDRGPQPIPPEADYLLYSSALYDDRLPADRHLGEDWYLRDLRR